MPFPSGIFTATHCENVNIKKKNKRIISALFVQIKLPLQQIRKSSKSRNRTGPQALVAELQRPELGGRRAVAYKQVLQTKGKEEKTKQTNNKIIRTTAGQKDLFLWLVLISSV